MGQGLFSLFFVVFGTVLIQAYIYRYHIIPPWLGGDNVTPLYVSWDEYSSERVLHAARVFRTARLTARTARLPNQGGIMSHHTIQFTRVSHALGDTQFVCLFVCLLYVIPIYVSLDQFSSKNNKNSEKSPWPIGPRTLGPRTLSP